MKTLILKLSSLVLLILLLQVQVVQAEADPAEGFDAWVHENPTPKTSSEPSALGNLWDNVSTGWGVLTNKVSKMIEPGPTPAPQPKIYIEKKTPAGMLYETVSADPMANRSSTDALGPNDILVSEEDVMRCRLNTPSQQPSGPVDVHDPNVNRGIYHKNWVENVERCLRGLPAVEVKKINYRNRDFEAQVRVQQEVERREAEAEAETRALEAFHCAGNCASLEGTQLTSASALMNLGKKFAWKQCVEEKHEGYGRATYFPENASAREKDYCSCLVEKLPNGPVPKFQAKELAILEDFNTKMNHVNALEKLREKFDSVNQLLAYQIDMLRRNAGNDPVAVEKTEAMIAKMREDTKACSSKYIQENMKRLPCYDELNKHTLAVQQFAKTVNSTLKKDDTQNLEISRVEDLFQFDLDVAKVREELIAGVRAGNPQLSNFNMSDLDTMVKASLTGVTVKLLKKRAEKQGQLTNKDISDVICADDVRDFVAVGLDPYAHYIFGEICWHKKAHGLAVPFVENFITGMTPAEAAAFVEAIDQGLDVTDQIAAPLMRSFAKTVQKTFDENVLDVCSKAVLKNLTEPDAGGNLCEWLEDGKKQPMNVIQCESLTTYLCSLGEDQRDRLTQVYEGTRCLKNHYKEADLSKFFADSSYKNYPHAAAIDDMTFTYQNCFEQGTLTSCASAKPLVVLNQKTAGHYNASGAEVVGWYVDENPSSFQNGHMRPDKLVTAFDPLHSSSEGETREGVSERTNREAISGSRLSSNVATQDSGTASYGSSYNAPSASSLASDSGIQNIATGKQDPAPGVSDKLDSIMNRWETLENNMQAAQAQAQVTGDPALREQIERMRKEIEELKASLKKAGVQNPDQMRSQYESAAPTRTVSNPVPSSVERSTTRSEDTPEASSPVSTSGSRRAFTAPETISEAPAASTRGAATTASSAIALTQQQMDLGAFIAGGGVGQIHTVNGQPQLYLEVAKLVDGKKIVTKYYAACSEKGKPETFKKYVKSPSDFKEGLYPCSATVEQQIGKVLKKAPPSVTTPVIERSRTESPAVDYDDLIRDMNSETE